MREGFLLCVFVIVVVMKPGRIHIAYGRLTDLNYFCAKQGTNQC
jgi:hypothetical protein